MLAVVNHAPPIGAAIFLVVMVLAFIVIPWIVFGRGKPVDDDAPPACPAVGSSD